VSETYAEPAAQAPPADLAAEHSVLGSMMMFTDGVEEITLRLRTGDYYLPKHQAIHAAIVDLAAAGRPVDPIAVCAELERRGELARFGGPGYIHGLTAAAGTVGAALWHADIVREKAERRALGAAYLRGVQALRDGELRAVEVAAFVEADVAGATEGRDAAEHLLIGDTLDAYEGELKETQTHGPRRGVRTGFADLDGLTGGLHPGQLVLIAARPAVGKSVLAVDIARQAAVRDGLPVVFYSLEMSLREITNRLFAATGRIALHHLGRKGGMTPEDWGRWQTARTALHRAPLAIDADPARTVADIHAACRRAKRRTGLSLVIVDYLQLLQSGRRTVENRQVEVAQMSRQLKLMAKDLEVPVVVVAQLNRGPEMRHDKRPMVSDLRESGALEADADVVILLHREDAYDKASPRAGEADLIVAKNRSGPTASITVASQLHYARFVDMALT
jgi:replicative DNA helicase